VLAGDPLALREIYTGCTAKYFSPKYYKNTEKIFQSKSKYFLNTSTQSCIKISK
jgi:hypothetical protein